MPQGKHVMTEFDAGRYNHKQVEAKWCDYWLSNKTFATPDTTDKPKYYVLDMFPYPSGEGLHVGHPEGYTASDIVSRYKRMKGFNVLHPMGWDAFGLPAEQYAVKTGTHPAITTKKNINNIRRQIQALGFSYDWDREISTTDEKYYKWTQWIFLKLHGSFFDHDAQLAKPISELIIHDGLSEAQINAYKDSKRLAYQAEQAVNWCPALGTVLANEEVTNGLSERGNHPVIRRQMKQWTLRITDYAERLLDGLEDLDWAPGIKKLQSDWIGKSTGCEVDFVINTHGDTLRVFTTRPDTLFGATYMVMAPEHRLLDKIVTEEQKDVVRKYQDATIAKSELERTSTVDDTKTGVFTGAYAINPVNNTEIPIWISDYVLISYGTGAIMAVPAHDDRDHAFATTFDLPILQVVQPLKGKEVAGCFAGHGTAINSGAFNGMTTSEFKTKITAWLAEKNIGAEAVNYKLRDWLFARQRYWGEPFPVLYLEDGSIVPVPQESLPVTLPQMEDFKPSGNGDAPLANNQAWVNTTYNGKPAKRETNTMPQWAGSCWYYIRYIDANNDTAPWDKEKANYWLPVDLYIGGAEHAVLHLLYSRFWFKVLKDCGWLNIEEPFQKLINQGMILGEDNQKMSKSRGNVVNPDEIIHDFGADSLRLYEMFMGPLEATKPWNTSGVEGVNRFLHKAWRMIIETETGHIKLAIGHHPLNEDHDRLLHQTIKKVTEDIENLSFNTAISQMMIFTNTFSKLENIDLNTMKSFVMLLAPFAPHIGEELWEKLGGTTTLTYEPWPTFDASKIAQSKIEYAIQVTGKMVTKILMGTDLDEKEIEAIARADDKVAAKIEGKTIRKVIVVKNRLVNIVAT